MKGEIEIIGKKLKITQKLFDYAHSPDALKTSLLNLREFSIQKYLYLVVVEIEIKIKDQKWVELHQIIQMKYI